MLSILEARDSFVVSIFTVFLVLTLAISRMAYNGLTFCYFGLDIELLLRSNDLARLLFISLLSVSWMLPVLKFFENTKLFIDKLIYLNVGLFFSFLLESSSLNS